jgi:hypothetical protein
MSDTNPTPYDHIVFTDFDGAEGILVDLNTKKYYQLNETAMLIWKSLEQGLTAEAIAAELTANYEISPEDARQNVANIVREFESYKLVGK